MDDTQKLQATVTRNGNTIRIRASKGGQPFTEEDRIQLHILEYQVMNYPETVTLDKPITLGD
jgi:hypothetical protein